MDKQLFESILAISESLIVLGVIYTYYYFKEKKEQKEYDKRDRFFYIVFTSNNCVGSLPLSTKEGKYINAGYAIDKIASHFKIEKDTIHLFNITEMDASDFVDFATTETK